MCIICDVDNKVPGKGQQLCGVDEELFLFFERLGLHPLRQLHRYMVLADCAEDLVNLSNLEDLF